MVFVLGSTDARIVAQEAAPEVPLVTIHANPFEALQVLDCLKRFKGKILICPRKTESVMTEKAERELITTFGLMVFDMIPAIEKDSPVLANELIKANELEGEKRKEMIMGVLEKFLKIPPDAKASLLERSERVVLAWIRSDPRISIQAMIAKTQSPR